MIFVERRVTSDDCNRSECPPEMHATLSRAYSSQNEQTQYEIFRDMACLADEIMEK